MPLTILMYGDCTSYNGRIREMLDYRGVGLARFHCIQLCKDVLIENVYKHLSYGNHIYRYECANCYSSL